MDYDSEDIEIWSDAADDEDDDDDIIHDFMIGPSLPDFSHQNPDEQNVNALMNWVAGFLWKPTGALFFGVFTHNIVGDCRCLSATVGELRRLSEPVGELSAPVGELSAPDSCRRLSVSIGACRRAAATVGACRRAVGA